jgi:hypothetical protein
MKMDNRTAIDNIPLLMDEQEIGFVDIAEDGTLTFRFKTREPGWRIRYALLNNLAESLTLKMNLIPAIRRVEHDLSGDIPPAPDWTKWLNKNMRDLEEVQEEFVGYPDRPKLLYDPNCNCPWNNGYNLVIPGHHIQCTSLKLPHHVDDVCGMTGHLDSKLR